MNEKLLQCNDIGTLKEIFKQKLADDRIRYYGHVRADWVDYANEYHWDESQQEGRLNNLKRHGVIPRVHKVLDMASGCGQFVLLALDKGYDALGVELDDWKIDFIGKKIELLNKPENWKSKFFCGVGENLPFDNDTFDYVTSFQTLEHVNNPAKVIEEMIRVTKVGGGINIMCPDYRSTFEAHYQLPWLPLFPKTLAKMYLKIMKRPTFGLDTIQYVTQPRIIKWLRQAEKNKRFVVLDENRVSFENALRRRGVPNLPGAYFGWRMFTVIRGIGHREFSVNLFIRILEK